MDNQKYISKIKIISMRGINFILVSILMFIYFGCSNMNVVIKNIKTSTVKVGKVHNLYELGDTIIYENVKSEIIRKKLRDGTIIRKDKVLFGNTQIRQISVKPSLKRP